MGEGGASHLPLLVCCARASLASVKSEGQVGNLDSHGCLAYCLDVPAKKKAAYRSKAKKASVRPDKRGRTARVEEAPKDSDKDAIRLLRNVAKIYADVW